MSSVLETFYFLFKSNADDVDDGAEKARKSVDNLDKGLDKTNKSANETSKSVVSVAGAVGKLIGAVASYAFVSSQVAASVSYVENLRKTSLAIGENIEELDAWGRASSRFGGDANTLQGTLKTLSDNMRQAAFTGEGSMSPALRRLGVNIRDTEGKVKSTLDLLPELAVAFERFSTAESIHLGEQLGLDQSTILMLKSGRSEVERIVSEQKRFGVVTKENAELTQKLSTQMSDTGNVFLSLRQRVGMAAVPALIVFFEKLEAIGEWIHENQQFVEGFFIAAAAAITAYYLPAMIRVAIATIAATWPILAIGAAIVGLSAAFAAIYDDIMAFANGQDSVIGEAVKKWPILGDIINHLVKVFKEFFEITGWVREGLMLAFTSPAKFIDFLGERIDAIKKRLEAFKNVASAIFGWVKDTSPIALASGAIDGKSIFETAGSANENLKNQVRIAQGSIATASSTPISYTTTSAMNARTLNSGDTSVAIDKIEVVTQATDAQGISTGIGSGLQRELQNALYNSDDGIKF